MSKDRYVIMWIDNSVIYKKYYKDFNAALQFYQTVVQTPFEVCLLYHNCKILNKSIIIGA
jgi:hypothetical protein